MQTIGGRLDQYKGVGPGFDAVRLGLALLVLFIHTSLIEPGIVGREADPLFPFAPVDRWALNFAAVPMFFVLSGFLVAASAERLSLGQFLANRVLRIIPALAVEITLSALILGPLLTSLPLSQYFGDHRFFSYFLNIVGSIHYELPGVFASNPEPNVVNGSLWTVPHELGCYVLLTALVVSGVYRRRWLLTATTIGLFAAAIVVFLAGKLGAPLPFQDKLAYVFVTRGAARLVPLFLLGMLLYRFRHSVPYRLDLAIAALGLYFALTAFGSPAWQVDPIFNAAAAPLLAYPVIYAGLSPALRLEALKGGDYSYGLYLYGFPIQQALLAQMPGTTNVPLFFALSFAATLALATVSWTFVEKPILKLRRRHSVAARIHVGQQPAPADDVAAYQARIAAAIGRRDGAAFT